MSLIDNETFLPGVITEVESDYSYGYDSSQFGTTDSVVVVGTAFSGPVGTPVPIYNPEHARYIFGKTYESGSKKAATLVSAIEDAYQKGSRTIYAVRISGKEASKDFEFNSDSIYKLRLRSTYPTNQAKDFFMVYDNKEGEEKIKIFKPAERATIVEKMQGAIVSENDTIVLELKLNLDYGLTKDSSLVDVISVVNDHPYNNVVRLGIVDNDGLEVTSSDFEARQILLGSLFPGAYFIGRDVNHITPDTHINYRLITDGSSKPYQGFNGMIYKDLAYNTDVNSNLPIYAKDNKVLAQQLKNVEVFSTKHFDFLETTGLVDRVFGKNNEDYEEVNIDAFDIYQRLGSGFAVTARAEFRADASGNELVPKIKETPATDVNRVKEIKDGIYSMLENMNAKYRVLACGNADEKIVGKLPRPKDFLVLSPVSTKILEGLIEVTPIIDPKAPVLPKKYEFNISNITDSATMANADAIYGGEVFTAIPFFDEGQLSQGVAPANGTVVAKKLVDPLLKTETGEIAIYSIYDSGLYEKTNIGGTNGIVIVEEDIYVLTATPTTAYDESPVRVYRKATEADLFPGVISSNEKFILSENNTRVYVLQLNLDNTGKFIANSKHVSMLGDIQTMMSENEDETIIFSQSNDFEVNEVIIQSGILNSVTLEEFVELLNQSHSLNHLFKFSIAEEGLIFKDDYVMEIEITTGSGVTAATEKLEDKFTAGGNKLKPVLLPKDREVAYNYNLYVPYKTNDNFARQLAQHCTYTSLKTAPTHGIMGVATLNNRSIASVAKRIDEVLELDFDLYAKTSAGRNMLDRNNMPYPIGKNVSIVFTQYPFYTDEGELLRSNGAAGYAGMVSNLPLDQSSTNQPILLGELDFELTNYQLTRLTQKGYVTIKQSYTKGLVVTDGITMAPVESPFRRLNVTRIIGGVEQLIREASEPFIGKQNNQANRNSLHTAIKSGLEKIKGTLIEAYEFNLVVDPKVMKFAYIDIDYNIVPIYEIREVRNRIKVKDQL
ncbi:hypothetical protein MKY88_24525 [Lysinibacillus sp. FSL R7-0073]|uniref:hypothetical protein n=1 Tax=Lysinibacillus sp. FSL R7-0073 TaxID=2921669 RepID=UPI0030F700BF